MGSDETTLIVDGLAQALRERCELNIVIPADPTAIDAVIEAVAKALRNQPGVVGQEFDIELALREALANAVLHGSQGDRTKFIECRVTHGRAGDVSIVVRDSGPGFDFTNLPNPLEGSHRFERHGRGIFLIKQLMDEVCFADGGRELHMHKAARRRNDARGRGSIAGEYPGGTGD
jgi:serine/threonine-protein kinase RsbW